LLPAGSKAKTCSDRCRSKRSRRLKRARSENGGDRHGTTQVPKELQSKVLEEELRPVAREAITQDVRNSIKRLMGLWPLAAKAIEEDLQSSDPILRQRAYQTLARYTVGQTPLVADEGEGGQGITVHFNLPRPDAPAPTAEPVEQKAIPAPAAEVRQCLVCERDKPLEDFVDGSDRCSECHAALKEKEQAILRGSGGS
jgi:hypothetical protein